MRPSDAVALLAPRKQPFAREIFQRLTAIPGVLSVTFVGSFCDREDLSGISDIDVVVVCESLGRATFDACSAAMASMSPALLGLPNHRLYLNTTFGPLKFDQPDQVVIHLMIYDCTSHRAHVLKSPFTCLDWERSPVCAGQTLAELYPVLILQPGDFLNARRSLSNYTDDLRRGVLSYRRYEFTEAGVTEKLEQAQLDERLRGEYACHIVKNLVQNYAKLVRRKNASLTTDELIVFWREALPGCSAFADEFLRLQQAKLRREPVFSAATVDFAKNFMAAFQSDLAHQWDSAPRLVFVRHAQTELNDGSFLGQGRDPGILTPPEPLDRKFAKVYCSPLRRTRETAQALQPGASLQADPSLAEIDYGEVEGLPIKLLAEKFPYLVTAWDCGEDAAFPGGESTGAVQQRLHDFLAAIGSESVSPILVVTHNVVVRCLIGDLLGVPMRDWHKLRVNHLDAFEVIRRGDQLHLSLTEAQKAALTDSLLPMNQHRVSDYTFLGLANNGKPIASQWTTLGYLVALVDTVNHQILDPRVADAVMTVTFDCDDKHNDPSEIMAFQEGALPSGFYPQTPVMLTEFWSPISAMLKRQFALLALRRTPGKHAVASGIWLPAAVSDAKPITEAQTAEELFWSIMAEAFVRANARKKYVSIVATTGWSCMPDDDEALAHWNGDRRAAADKILWKRTPQGKHLP